MKRLAALLVVVHGLSHAAGGTALDAFNFTTGARAAGMGGAATATVADATALQWNPAGLARIPGYAASLSHLIWVAGINYSYAGFAAPVPVGFAGLPVNMTAGASIQALNYGTIESTRGLASAVDASDLGFTFGGGVRVADAVSAGAALKYFHHALAGAGVSEAAVDLGGVYEAVPEHLAFAAVVQNIGYAGALEGRSAPLPTSAKLGFAFGFAATQEPVPVEGETAGWSPDVRLLVDGDIIAYQRGEPVNYNVGVEGNLNRVLFGRLGYLGGLKAAGGSAGVSVGGGLAFYGFSLDYAYGSVGDLGRAQYVTLSWALAPGAKPTPTVEVPVTARPDQPVVAPADNADQLYREAAAAEAAGNHAVGCEKALATTVAAPGHWQAWQLVGNCRYAAGDPAGALAAYGKSLELHPDNPDLAVFIRQLKTP
jgi:hypothetical protein